MFHLAKTKKHVGERQLLVKLKRKYLIVKCVVLCWYISRICFVKYFTVNCGQFMYSVLCLFTTTWSYFWIWNNCFKCYIYDPDTSIVTLCPLFRTVKYCLCRICSYVTLCDCLFGLLTLPCVEYFNFSVSNPESSILVY